MATNKDLKQGNPASSTSEFLQCGYLIHNIETAELKNKCVFCHFIIKEPIQLTECGDRCCRGCYESRAAVSDNGKMTCPAEGCRTEFDKSEIMVDRAFKKELDFLPVVCVHKIDQKCPWTGTLNTYQEHLDKLHTNFLCALCSKSFSSTQALADHKQKTCEHLFQRCLLAPNCGEELIRRDDFHTHLLSEKHQEAIALALVGKCDIQPISDQDQEMETSSDNNELEEETSDQLSELADKVQKLNDDTVQLSCDFVKLNELYQVASQEVNNLQVASEERAIVMSSLQPKQEALQKGVEELKKILEESQHVSTDGTLTWRVDNVGERMADAQSERVPSIYSPIFYSSSHGYKMRVRLYLHGDGNARRTHMSLFFLLMKGEYDALLPWPFGYKVTFCLFDQTGNNRHIIDSFRPDTKSNSFQRPTNDANVASGIPKFFPLPMIQQDDNNYVRDDTLFLKIIVDLNDTPKMVLPYMLTLNPGLPNHVQRVLINQERVKRQQQQNDALASPQDTPMNTCG